MKSTMKIEHGIKVWRNGLGERHREDGPAIEGAEGFRAWCRNGVRYTPTPEEVAAWEAKRHAPGCEKGA